MDPNNIYVGDGSSGLRIFVDYLFDTWNLRYMYAQVPEYVAELFESGGSLSKHFPFCEVGRLPDYLFHGGRYYDMLVYALSRQDRDLATGD